MAENSKNKETRGEGGKRFPPFTKKFADENSGSSFYDKGGGKNKSLFGFSPLINRNTELAVNLINWRNKRMQTNSAKFNYGIFQANKSFTIWENEGEAPNFAGFVARL
jgi:hypothetical protein